METTGDPDPELAKRVDNELDEEKYLGDDDQQKSQDQKEVKDIEKKLYKSSNAFTKNYHRSRLFIAKNQLAACLILLLVQLVSVILVLVFYRRLYGISEFGASALFSALVSGLSQGILQPLVHKKFLPWTTVKFHVWGVINGVLMKLWTDTLLDRVSSNIGKVICDQTIGNTIMVFLFVSFCAYWDGLDVDKYLNRYFLHTLRKSLLVWPIASFVSFCILPSSFIIPFNAVVSLIWMVMAGLVTR